MLVGVDEEAIKEGTERDPILIAKYQQVFYLYHFLYLLYANPGSCVCVCARFLSV